MTSSPTAATVAYPPHEVYVASERGAAELRRGMTRLSQLEIELLVRLDGASSLDRIHAGMAGVSEHDFADAVATLRERGLVKPAQTDTFAARLQADALRMAGAGAAANADSQLASLRAAGFFVGIARRPAAPRACAEGRQLTAVVVEDEPVLARFIKSYLALEGIEARVAANRAEVVAELRKPPVPDVILLDVQLPDADGFDILQKLRAHPAFRTTPVIMLTGQATRASVLRGIAAGADGYMTKPFEADALVKAVHTVLGLGAPAASQWGDPWVNRDCQQGASEHRRGWTQ
jgi:two-component system OmpR family response regulator